jgi:hypothetical protein
MCDANSTASSPDYDFLSGAMYISYQHQARENEEKTHAPPATASTASFSIGRISLAIFAEIVLSPIKVPATLSTASCC